MEELYKLQEEGTSGWTDITGPLTREECKKYYDAELNEGTLITKPVTFSADSLTVNANIQSKIKVRVVDAYNNPIEGFEYVTIRGDKINHNVKWKKELSILSGKIVRFEFKVNNAQLFGFDLH